METITTVGYGDFSGGTAVEYCFTMLVQFTGLWITSVLMTAMTKYVNDDFTFDQYIIEKFNALDLWITKIEKANKPKFINPQLFHDIRKNLEVAFGHDFNTIVEEFHFYQQLTPRDQTMIIDQLFGKFKN